MKPYKVYLVHVFVRFFALDRAQNTMIVYFWQRN